MEKVGGGKGGTGERIRDSFLFSGPSLFLFGVQSMLGVRYVREAQLFQPHNLPTGLTVELRGGVPLSLAAMVRL